MDYDFYGTPGQHYYAECSMGHELFGQWLTEYVGQNHGLLQTVITACEQLKGAHFGQHITQTGPEVTLQLSPEQAQLTAHALYNDSAPTEELNLDEARLHSACGLEDFYALLCAWADFIPPAKEPTP